MIIIQLCFSVHDYLDCVKDQPDQRWYLKKKCYDSNSIQEFLETLDVCLLSGEISDACKIRLEFDMGNTKEKDLTGITELSQGYSGRLFKYMDDTCGRVYKHFEASTSLSERSKKRILQIDMSPEKPDDRDNEVMENLKRLTDAKKPLSKWIGTYCDSQKERKTLIKCVAEIVRPLETFSSAEFFSQHLANRKSNIYNLGGFFWPIPLTHVLAWFLVCIGVAKGPKWLGKLVYVTAIFPIVMMLILIIFAVTLDGHELGVKYYLKTDFCKMGDFSLWLDALGQVFFTLSIGGGGLMTLASYNRFSNDVLRDAVIVAFGNCIFSFISGFGIFGILGFMAKSLNVPVEDALASGGGGGPGLAFITISQATGLMPVPQLWGVLFFLMLSFLAIDSSFAFMETLMTYLIDEFSICKNHKFITLGVVGVTGYTLGLPGVSRGAVYILGPMLDSVFNYGMAMASIVELVVVCYIYGWRNMTQDIGLMFGFNVGKYHLGQWFWSKSLRRFFTVAWVATAPVGVVVLFLGYLIKNKLMEDKGDYVLMSFMIWGMVFLYPFLLCAVFLYRFIYCRMTCQQLLKPRKEWGPALNKHRSQDPRYAPLETPSEKVEANELLKTA